MILHGDKDPRDPVTESDQFVRAIREHGGTVDYLRFPDEGHSIRKLSNRMIAYRRIAAFSRENARHFPEPCRCERPTMVAQESSGPRVCD